MYIYIYIYIYIYRERERERETERQRDRERQRELQCELRSQRARPLFIAIGSRAFSFSANPVLDQCPQLPQGTPSIAPPCFSPEI